VDSNDRDRIAGTSSNSAAEELQFMPQQEELAGTGIPILALANKLD
jgi:hypothetical protein